MISSHLNRYYVSEGKTMNSEDRFRALGVSNMSGDLTCDIDFCHSDIEAQPPAPSMIAMLSNPYAVSPELTYHGFRGARYVRALLSDRLHDLFGMTGDKIIDPDKEIILTPGTQGALFLALSSVIGESDHVVCVEPDYFAYREQIMYLGAIPDPISLGEEENLEWTGAQNKALESFLSKGAKAVIFSNPNNPTGFVFSRQALERIYALIKQYHAVLIVDELQSRMIYDQKPYSHALGITGSTSHVIAIIGPSKTEGLTGIRAGVAIGDEHIIDRMEALQGIVSLRCASTAQAALTKWLADDADFLSKRISDHQKMRDILHTRLTNEGFSLYRPDGGIYLFASLPGNLDSLEFVSLLAREEGVRVTGGSVFGRNSYIRINFSQSLNNIEEGVTRIISLAKRLGGLQDV